MYFLVFLLQLINLYVVFNVTLKSATWFTTNIQVPTLNYLNSFANIPTKYFLLPHLHIETDESDDSEESNDSYDSSPEDSSDVNRTDISTESDSDSTESDSTETASDCETSESESDHKIPDDDNSSDSDDEVKHLPVKPSVIIMDEKLD